MSRAPVVRTAAIAMSMVLALATAPVALAAQEPPEAEAPGAASVDVRWQLGALLGVTGRLSGHAFGGVEGAIFRGRWGAAGMLHGGTGNGYRSLLTGAGPSVEVTRVSGFRIQAWGGPGYLREELDTSHTRASLVGIVSASARRKLSRGAVTVRVSWLGGSLDGEDFVTSAPISGFRLSAGFGW